MSYLTFSGKKEPLKNIAYLLVAVVFAVAMYSYYDNNNAAGSLSDVQDDISTLINTSTSVKKSNKKEEYTVFLSDVREVKSEINHNNLITSEIKKWFERDAEPNLRNLDTTKNNDLKSKNDELFQPLIYSLKGVSNNQRIASIAIYIFFLLFISLALFTNILRDIVNDPVLKQQVQDGNYYPPFSLSRTQLGLWITIIASFYVHAIFWRNCSSIGNNLNTTALILMGISAGTFATGAIIDTAEIEQGATRNQNQLSSGNFFKDILSDSQGVSIHRFQNVVWTLVAIIVYFYCYNNNVLKGCLPDLDTTLLALTGISSATYLTLKARENVFFSVRILLNVDASKKSEVEKNGWTQIEVKLKDSAGKEILATRTPTSNYEFTIGNLTPGNCSISVAAKAKINDTETNFVGAYNGIVNSTTAQPIAIPVT